MPRSRKTIQVESLRDKVNNMLSYPDGKPQERQGMIILLTSVLHDTGNYHGFRYLSQNELPSHIKPGIRDNNDSDQMFEDTDPTRVHYY